MRRRLTALLGLALAMVVSLAPAGVAGTGEQFTVSLSGDQVVPGPGDPDGGGGVLVTVGKTSGKEGTFCFFADTSNVSTPLTAVHLHRGPRGEEGELVLVLHGRSETDPDVSNCLTIDRDLEKDIRKNKENYYIDIHNEEFPDGAVRGQFA